MTQESHWSDWSSRATAVAADKKKTGELAELIKSVKLSESNEGVHLFHKKTPRRRWTNHVSDCGGV